MDIQRQCDGRRAERCEWRRPEQPCAGDADEPVWVFCASLVLLQWCCWLKSLAGPVWVPVALPRPRDRIERVHAESPSSISSWRRARKTVACPPRKNFWRRLPNLAWLGQVSSASREAAAVARTRLAQLRPSRI